MNAIRQFARKHITAFRVLYFGVAIYTLRHSAIGFATLESDAFFGWAILAALVIDIGMLLAAEKVREKQAFWMIAGLLISCAVSAFAQLLFSVTNASAVSVAAGANWMDYAASLIIKWRVVILPLVMPILVIVYAFASKTEKETPEKELTQDDNIMEQVQDVVSELEKKPTKAQMAVAIHERHNDWTMEKIAEAVPCSVSTVSRAINNNGSG